MFSYLHGIRPNNRRSANPPPSRPQTSSSRYYHEKSTSSSSNFDLPLLENLNLSASTNHLSHQILLPYPQSHALLLSANFAERMDRKSKCKRRRPYGLVGKGNLKRNHGYQPQNQCWATITLRNLSKTTLIELLWKRKHRNHLPLQNNFDPLRAGENAPLTLPTSLCALTVSLLEDSLLELILATSNSYLSL